MERSFIRGAVSGMAPKTVPRCSEKRAKAATRSPDRCDLDEGTANKVSNPWNELVKGNMETGFSKGFPKTFESG